MLAQIIAQVAAFRAAYTDAKAAYLDATISSRAPSSTALSSSTWTGTKAGYLDTTISSRASQSDVTAIKADTDAYLDAKVSEAGMNKPSSIVGYTIYERPGNSGLSRHGTVSCGATTSQWYNYVSVNGSGWIHLLGVDTSTQNPTGTWNIRLLIDNVQVFYQAGVFTSATKTNEGYLVVGSGISDGSSPYWLGVSFGLVRFTTSFQLQVQRTGTGGASNFNGLVFYQLD